MKLWDTHAVKETVLFTGLTVDKATDEVLATWQDMTSSVIGDLPYTELTTMLKARYGDKPAPLVIPGGRVPFVLEVAGQGEVRAGVLMQGW